MCPAGMYSKTSSAYIGLEYKVHVCIITQRTCAYQRLMAYDVCSFDKLDLFQYVLI